VKASPAILREARKRAGLSQAALARRTNRPQQSIARWEAGRVEPSLETLTELVRACGWELVTDLARADPEYESEIRRQLRLSPPARLRSTLRADLDPRSVLRELEHSGLRYVLVGGLAAALRGSPRLLDRAVVEVVPAPGQTDTSEGAVASLGAERVPAGENDAAVERERYGLATRGAELWLTARPWGTYGFRDLGPDAERMPLGRGLSVGVASARDLARIAAAAPPASEGAQAATLRTVARLGR
jgi:transcriptional regulator with XRE-family HTH domain